MSARGCEELRIIIPAAAARRSSRAGTSAAAPRRRCKAAFHCSSAVVLHVHLESMRSVTAATKHASPAAICRDGTASGRSERRQESVRAQPSRRRLSSSREEIDTAEKEMNAPSAKRAPPVSQHIAPLTMRHHDSPPMCHTSHATRHVPPHARVRHTPHHATTCFTVRRWLATVAR